MRFIKIYRQALAVLRSDKRLAIMLGVANVIVAGLQFLDPVLFGRVIGLLTRSDNLPSDRDGLTRMAMRLEARAAARQDGQPPM